MEEFIHPIATAPLDAVVLTDEGFARYVDHREWGSPVEDGWYLCYSSGEPFKDADEGMDPFKITPKWWVRMPAFPS